MKRSVQVSIVVFLALLPMLGLLLTSPSAVAIHDVYQRFCYLPIILAGLWFGVRGGVLTGLLVGVVYFPEALFRTHEFYPVHYRFMGVIMYVVIGWLTGWLSDRLYEANRLEQGAREAAESAYLKLKDQTEELLTMGERLRISDRLAVLGQLSTGLAHEIRNPLASIKTAVEILHARNDYTPVEEDDPDFIAIILEETEHLDKTLTEFLMFARSERLRPSDEPHAASVAEVFQGVLELTESDRQKHHVSVRVDEQGLDVQVAICQAHLHQVLLNLLINSVDSMPTGGEFRLHRLANEGNLVVLLAEDTGPGIPPEIAARIFDPFFSTKHQGTGLGLPIVERLLFSNGGSIALATTNGGPTSRFIVKLPLEV